MFRKFTELFKSEDTAPTAVAIESLHLTQFRRSLLEKCVMLDKPMTHADNIDVDLFLKKSESFPAKFPIDTCRVKTQPIERYDEITQQIASAYPIIHERVLLLYLNFLEHKCAYGNEIELQIYKQLTLSDFITRLLTKRCAYFLNAYDRYQLIDGPTGYGGFEEVGTLAEKSPLLLQNVLSYDEIKLSALLSVSSHTEFINNGTRLNKGIVETDKSKIEPEGVIVGLIGARFARPNMMEWQDIIITSEQNTIENGYGKQAIDERNSNYRQLWQRFYEQSDQLYKEVKQQLNSKQKRFIQLKDDIIFDSLLMAKRFAISFDTLLLEAEARAAAAKKQAFIHVVGIGLGVWKIANEQEEIFLQTFEQRLRALLNAQQLAHIGALRFHWFGVKESGDLKHNCTFPHEKHPNGGIRILFNNDNPADKLQDEFANMLPVISFAWDANSLSGNEFWGGNLWTSSDPAATSSTLISELHNGHINEQFVNGNNLHIATLNAGVMHISDYSKKLLKETKAEPEII